MRDHLRAGIAIHNAGHYHAAHDAWEDYWLDLASGTDDEQLLHGLIQFTAAVHHARNRNWEGATGLADSAGTYLADLPDTYRGVDVAAARAYLATLASDPEVIERGPVLRLSHEGTTPMLADLDVPAATVAATVLAEEFDVYEEAVLDAAADYAREDLAAGDEDSTFVGLVLAFVRESDDRDLVYQRLAEHVRRRASRDADVDGLFD